MELLYLLGAALLIMFASLTGVIFVSKHLASWTQDNLRYLIAFAAGVFLIVTYDLIFEALEFAEHYGVVVVSVIVGFLLFFILEKVYPEAHCHHDDAACQANNSTRGARKVLIGDAFHNIGDGILLAPIFMIDIKLGFVAAFGIFVHEAVQEISEFFVLKAAGYTTKEALLRNFLVSATVLIGAIGGFYLASVDYFVAPLVAFTAGAFLHILLVDLIPQSVRHSHKEAKYLNYIVWALLGILLIVGVDALAAQQLEKQGLDGHGHLESEHHDDHEEGHHEHE